MSIWYEIKYALTKQAYDSLGTSALLWLTRLCLVGAFILIFLLMVSWS